MLSFFNFLRPVRPDHAYTVLARHGSGSWFKSFTVPAPDAATACKRFDDSNVGNWERVSDASRKSHYRNY
jgi:hypothetical protein